MSAIPGVGPDAPIEVNARGGGQSAVPYRFDLVDPAAMFAMTRVLASECVWLLPGWETSKGVAIELQVARAIGVPVIELHSNAS